jgi:transcriptional regulator with XRE-family HTH domain
MEFIWETPSEIDMALAQRLKRIGKIRKLTQKELAARCNVSYGALKKFEQSGEISLKSLTKIAMELGVVEELRRLFSQPQYSSIEEVLRDGR